MNQPIEDIFDQALSQLRRGQTVAEVLSAYPDHAAELQSLLEVAAMGNAIPRNIVPTPLRRRSFAQTAYRSWWVNSVNILKFGAIPLTVVFLLLGTRALIAKTEASLPNQPLYTLKRASEKLQLSLTRDANRQAELQLELTQRRLDEVKQAAASQDPDQEAAALAELNDQSQKTFDTVPPVTAATALAAKDSSLLDSLVAINKQQQEVLTAIQPQPETKEATDIALSTAKEHGLALASLVATVQEQSLADLQNKISLTGEATVSRDKTTVTIEGTGFAINDDTLITLPAGDPIGSLQLPGRIKANVVGVKTGSGVVAKFISLTENLPAVQPTPKPVVPEETETPTSQDFNQNEVTAGVIAEPPTQEYQQ